MAAGFRVATAALGAGRLIDGIGYRGKILCTLRLGFDGCRQTDCRLNVLSRESETLFPPLKTIDVTGPAVAPSAVVVDAMKLDIVTDRSGVESAMDEYDRLGQDVFLAKYGYKPAREYFVERDGKLYDSRRSRVVARVGSYIISALRGAPPAQTSPLRTKRAAALLEGISSLARIVSTWLETVRRLIPNLYPISLSAKPSTSCRSTSSSPGVSPAGASGPHGCSAVTSWATVNASAIA
jgi:hypothetical protein